VLNTFPDIPINIEIKMIKTTTGTARRMHDDNAIRTATTRTSSMVVADKLAALLNEDKYASRDDLIVVSFSDQLIDEFHGWTAALRRACAPGDRRHDELRPRRTWSRIRTSRRSRCRRTSWVSRCRKYLLSTKQAHCLGYAVHIWTNGDQDETPAAYSASTTRAPTASMTSRPAHSRSGWRRTTSPAPIRATR
jgi:hypothetical protein